MFSGEGDNDYVSSLFLLSLLMDNLICRLEPFDENNRGTILPDGKEVIVGRSAQFNVNNIFCSRKQISLIANYKDKVVNVKLLGRPLTVIDGKRLSIGESVTVVHESVIELVEGFLKYQIVFSDSGKRANTIEKGYLSFKKRIMTSLYWEQLCSDEVLLGFHSEADINKNKVASFDLDGTLIKTKSGRVFPIDSNDWTIWDKSVKTALVELHKNDYQIIIFSNQASLSRPRGKMLLNEFKRKVENIIESLNVPISIYISTSDGYYRKPAPGMWDLFKSRNPNLELNMVDSFYVGDAAGRPSDWKPGKKADFAASDRLFALNTHLRFFTPEEFFLKDVPFLYPELTFIPDRSDEILTGSANYSFPTDGIEVILMVGSPASGKSHFVKNCLVPENYHCVSRDNLGSWQKCVASLQKLLDSNKKVVIDNTNSDKASRQRYIEVCKNKNIPVRCFIMKTTLERCLHNNKFRQITDSYHQVISPHLIKNFHKTLEYPTSDEGFSGIVEVSFVPLFSNSQHKNIYNYFLVG